MKVIAILETTMMIKKMKTTTFTSAVTSFITAVIAVTSAATGNRKLVGWPKRSRLRQSYVTFTSSAK